MNAKEAWNYLVSEYEKNFSAQEDTIQTLWESYLANPFLFGYSDSDDIDSKRTLHIGSTDREIPDIILRSNHNDICIIELKKYSLPKNSNFEKQLLNYMSHTDLHLSIGVLVCKTLNIYHFDHAKNITECLEIPFEKDSKNGETFISLISKSNFSEDEIINFIQSENESKENVRNLKSEITADLLKGLIIRHFENKYSVNDIEKVLSELNITVSEKSAMQGVSLLVNKAKTTVPVPIVNAVKVQNKENTHPTSSKMDKPEAVQLLRKEGLGIYGKTTFSSKNRGAPTYWANPNISYIYDDWWLILNDWENRTLHAFFIPANSIKKENLKFKTPKLIDIKIQYEDDSFQDTRSKIYFHNWLVRSKKY